MNVRVIDFELAPARRSSEAIFKETVEIGFEDTIVPEATPADTKSILVSTLIPEELPLVA